MYYGSCIQHFNYPLPLSELIQQMSMMIFFLSFQEKGFDISCKLSPLETICMKSQKLFARKFFFFFFFFKMLSVEIFTQHVQVLYQFSCVSVPCMFIVVVHVYCCCCVNATRHPRLMEAAAIVMCMFIDWVPFLYLACWVKFLAEDILNFFPRKQNFIFYANCLKRRTQFA